MGIKKLLERHWLRSMAWRDEGRQDQQTGEMLGARDRWPRILCRALSAHWLRHWTFYAGCITALVCAAVGSDAFKNYMEHKRVEDKAAEQRHECPAAIRLLPLDCEKNCPVAPLRCD